MQYRELLWDGRLSKTPVAVSDQGVYLGVHGATLVLNVNGTIVHRALMEHYDSVKSMGLRYLSDMTRDRPHIPQQSRWENRPRNPRRIGRKRPDRLAVRSHMFEFHKWRNPKSKVDINRPAPTFS